MFESQKEIEELHAAIEEGAKQNQANFRPAIQVEDLSEIAQKYLTANARYDQAQKAMNLTVVDKDNNVYTAIYFATRVIKGDEERAIEYLAPILNDLSQKGLVHSTLAPLSSLNLAMDSGTLQSVVFTFVLIPKESHDDVRKLYPKFVVEEGDVGHSLYEINPFLSEGEFLTVIRLSATFTQAPYDSVVSDRLLEQIQQYLAVLPKGTRVRRVSKLAITDLSLPFEVKFYNPLMNQVKRIELDYRRAIAKVSESHLQQFNVFREIKYFDKDGKEIYK